LRRPIVNGSRPAAVSEGVMGTVIRFPLEKRTAGERGKAPATGACASIIILPVVRIERHRESVAAPRAALPALPYSHPPGEAPAPVRRS
jgi:hypothetical protein